MIFVCLRSDSVVVIIFKVCVQGPLCFIQPDFLQVKQAEMRLVIHKRQINTWRALGRQGPLGEKKNRHIENVQ